MAGPRPTAAQEPVRVFVSPFKAKSRSLKNQAQVLYEAMTSAMLGTGRFLIAASASDQEIDAAVQSCNRDSVDQSCWIRVGLGKGAQKLVSGTLRGKGKSCYVTVRLVDLETRLEEKRVFDVYNCKVEDLLSRVDDYAWRLAGVSAHPSAVAANQGPEAAAESVQEVGVLRLVTVPKGAEVYLDAEPVGTTPLTLKEVPVGEHSLLVTKDGYVDLAKSVTVRKGRPTLVKEKLVRESGTLHIVSNPPGAKVILDGKARKGKTPMTIPQVSVGKHRIELRLEKHRPWKTEVVVDPSAVVDIEADLAGKPGKLLVSSVPKGAKVFVDGVDSGKTLARIPLDPGKHVVRVEKEGYEPETRDVTIDSGKALSLSVTLTKRVEVSGAQIAGHEITLFTAGQRPFTDKDRRLLGELERMGFRVDRSNYPSNPDPNIKVGRGKVALAKKVLAVVAKYYPDRHFTIKDIFKPGDTDVFINLGDEGGAGRQPLGYSPGDFEITLFTPDKRPFTPQEGRLLDEFESMGFKVDRRNYPSNPTSNVKVARGRRDLAEKVLGVLGRYYRGDFEILEIFEPGDRNVFINVGPARPIGGQGATSLGAYKITIFTPGGRAFNRADRRLVRELESMGFRVTQRPGGGRSNPDSNVKVGKGNAALGRRVREVMRHCYDQPFTVKELFDEGDTDIYVNLGEDADSRNTCNGAGSEPGGEELASAFHVVIFTPRSRPFNQADRKLIEELESIGFDVKKEPGGGGSNRDSNVKVGKGKRYMGDKVRAIVRKCYDQPFTVITPFDADDHDIYVNLGEDAVPRPECMGGAQQGPTAVPSGAELAEMASRHTITIFTPGGRPFTAADRTVIMGLKALGFRVDDSGSGAGGTNPSSNVKVGKGNRGLGEVVRKVLKRCYDQPFPVLEIFDEGDTDIYVNLGEDADSKVKCSSTRL